ncbi:MAG: signal peptidase I [Leptospira sp.]|nr:signal peptidase I [Leptospira sp.]
MAKLSGNPVKEAKKEKQSPLSSILSLVFIIVLVLAFKSSILDANNIPTGSMIPTLKIGDFLFVNKMRYSIRMPGTERELFRIDDPKRGDIVTFDPPTHAISEEKSQLAMFSKRFVKRVVGMPGDIIRINRKSIDTTRGRVDYSFFEYKERGSDSFKNYNPIETSVGKELSDLDNPEASKRALFLEEKRNFKHFVLEGYDDERRFLISGMGGDFRVGCDFKTGCEIPDGQYMVMGDNRDDSSDSRVWGFVKREDILGKALIIYFSINWKDNTRMNVRWSRIGRILE